MSAAPPPSGMSGYFDPSQQLVSVVCCVCGCEIQQNPANMCVSCLRENVDITSGINKELTIHSCRSCNRWLCPPWMELQLESKELMATCLRKIGGLNKVKLIDAVWIWTEPHSLRLKIKLTVQKEVVNNAILQQAVVVTFTIRNQQCKDCEASYAQGAWKSVVQVRQRVSHKRTFFFLEQLLLAHNAHKECINIVTFKDGMDFYFTDKQKAVRFIDFLSHHVPQKSKYSRKLVSADHKSNVGDFKHNFIVMLAPLCKDDLVIIPRQLANNLSDISQLCLIKSVGAGIHVIDPCTGEKQELSTEKYFNNEFIGKMNSRQLIKYVVLSVEPVLYNSRQSSKKRGGVDKKTRLAEVVVAREADFGVTDTQYTCVTHLGNILREGDFVLGYDLSRAHWVADTQADDRFSDDKRLALHKKQDVPDVILVRKYYATKGDRKWMLKNFESDVNEAVKLSAKEQEAMEEDYEEFLQTVEADRDMRKNIRLYKASSSSGGADRDSSHETRSQKRASGSSSKRTKTDAGGALRDGRIDEGDKEGGDDDEGAFGALRSGDDSDDEFVRLEELIDDMALNLDEGSGALLTSEQARATPALNIDEGR